MKANYVDVPMPDKYIRIGLKDGNVVQVDWAQLDPIESTPQDLINYLEVAIAMVGGPSVRRVKKANKEKARAVKKKAKLEKDIKENPDWCFCEELLGKDPDIDPRTDPVIDTIQGYGGPLRNAMIDYDVYKCKRCGKKAHINIVFA